MTQLLVEPPRTLLGVELWIRSSQTHVKIRWLGRSYHSISPARSDEFEAHWLTCIASFCVHPYLSIANRPWFQLQRPWFQLQSHGTGRSQPTNLNVSQWASNSWLDKILIQACTVVRQEAESWIPYDLMFTSKPTPQGRFARLSLVRNCWKFDGKQVTHHLMSPSKHFLRKHFGWRENRSQT